MEKPKPTELIDPIIGVKFSKDPRSSLRPSLRLSAYAGELKEATLNGGIVMGGMTVGRLQQLFGIYISGTETEVTSTDLDILGSEWVAKALCRYLKGRLRFPPPTQPRHFERSKIWNFCIADMPCDATKDRVVEVIEGFPAADPERKESYWISTIDVPFKAAEGARPERIRIVDPISTTLDKLQIRRLHQGRAVVRAKDWYHLQFLALSIPPFLEAARKGHIEIRGNDPYDLCNCFLRDFPKIRKTIGVPKIPGWKNAIEACLKYMQEDTLFPHSPKKHWWDFGLYR